MTHEALALLSRSTEMLSKAVATIEMSRHENISPSRMLYLGENEHVLCACKNVHRSKDELSSGAVSARFRGR